MLEEKVLKSVADDLLNRSSVAETVRRRILSHKASTGLRIAVFGDWGSGKSSLAEWIVDGLPRDGWAVVRLAPWSCRTFEDFWNELAWGLLDAAMFHDRRPKSNARQRSVEARAWLNKNVFKRTREIESDDTVGIFFRAAHRVTALTEKDVESILKSLEGCPVAVIIDDLDRMDPQVLPKALMTIRDGFANLDIVFLVPLDRGVAARAIEAYTPAWAGAGELFLEKIFDYRINVPEPSARERVDMLQGILGELMGRERAPQLIDDIGHVLPPIPRRLKAIARQIEIVSELIENHHAFELDSNALILAATIKAESDELYSGFVKKFAATTLDDMALGAKSSSTTKRQLEDIASLGASVFGDNWNGEAARESHERAIAAARMLLASDPDAGYSSWVRAVRILSVPPPISLKQLGWLQSEDLEDDAGLRRRLGISYPAIAIARDIFAWSVINIRSIIDGKNLNRTDAPFNENWLALMAYSLRSDRFALSSQTALLRLAGFEQLMRWTVLPTVSAEMAGAANAVLHRLADTSGRAQWNSYAEILFEPEQEARCRGAIAGTDEPLLFLSQAAVEHVLAELRAKDGGTRLVGDTTPRLAQELLADPNSVLWKNNGVDSGVARLLREGDQAVSNNTMVIRERLLSNSDPRWRRIAADANVIALLSGH